MQIASIYLSSTNEDLKAFRNTVGAYLRKLNKRVVGMEDYVASDERPLNKCLAGVADADLYVGIFAHRYGFIPTTDNPESKSITEREYRHALACGKPTLIFLLDEKAPWPPPFMDHVTGEGDKGKRIDVLRAELGKDKTVSRFQDGNELAALVNTAVMNLESVKSDDPGAVAATTNAPEYRQITSDLFITYGTADETIARTLAEDMLPNPQGLSSLLSASDVFAATESAFLGLDYRLHSCDVAMVVLSPLTLAQMADRPASTKLALETMRARAGVVVGACIDAASLDGARRWDSISLIDLSAYRAGDMSALRQIKATLSGLCTPATLPLIGVPLVLAAMTRDEAEMLSEEPDRIGEEIGLNAQRRFVQIKDALPHPLPARYGPTRETWLSPGSTTTVAQISLEALEKLVRVRNPRLRGRAVKLQRYPFDPLMDNVQELREVYRQMAEHGCIMIVDELSLFHPGVRKALAACPMISARNTAILTVSPFGTALPLQHGILRDELKSQLAAVMDRFELDFDPQCELGVGDEWRLRRWLHQSLPETLQILRAPRVEPAQVALFAKELQADQSSAPAGPPGIL